VKCKSDIRHGSKLKNSTSSHTKFITDAKNNAKFTSNYKSKDIVYRNYRSEQLMRTRGVEKIIQEDQKRAKELTTIDKNIEDKILQKHETHANKTNNVYDCLNEFDEKVSLISDIDTALPKSHATEWSNGERQYNLTQKNHSVLHNGGIWKSITNEKV
jgi:ABC-type glutathione transport system ATPase component